MPDDEFTKGLVTGANVIKEGINDSLIGAVVLSIAFKGVLFLILSMINSL